MTEHASLPVPEDRVATAPDGRRITYTVSGPDGALPVVVHHGTPGSAHPTQAWLRATVEQDVRLVTYERGGYGGSDRHPGRSVADAAADLAVVLDAIGADVCVTEGRSGGGPHALACAALLPDRVLAPPRSRGWRPTQRTAAPASTWTGGSRAWARTTSRSLRQPSRAKQPFDPSSRPSCRPCAVPTVTPSPSRCRPCSRRSTWQP